MSGVCVMPGLLNFEKSGLEINKGCLGFLCSRWVMIHKIKCPDQIMSTHVIKKEGTTDTVVLRPRITPVLCPLCGHGALSGDVGIFANTYAYLGHGGTGEYRVWHLRQGLLIRGQGSEM